MYRCASNRHGMSTYIIRDFKEKKLQLKLFMMQSGDPQEDHVMEYSDDEVISDAEAPIGPESSQER